MLPGIAAPWMLAWLGATALPLVLGLLANRHPRVRRFAPIELVIRAAGRAHISRWGISRRDVIVRGLLVAAAALAATRPFLRPAADAVPPRGTPLVAGHPDRRIAIVAPTAAGRIALPAAAAAVVSAIESLGESPPRRDGRGAAATVELVPLGAVAETAEADSAGARLVIFPDGTVPGPSEAARIVVAVDHGLAVVVCLGPAALDERLRGRTTAWLESLTGGRLEGVLRLDDAPVEVTAAVARRLGLSAVRVGEATPGQPAAAADGGFVPLPGPAVSAIASVAPPAGEILARVGPDLPLLWSVRRGRGRVCVSAVPLSLPPRRPSSGAAEMDDAWSDLAAWPVFVPLVETVLEEACPGVLAPVEPRSPRPSPALWGEGGRVRLAPALVALAMLLTLLDRFRSRPGGRAAAAGATTAARARGTVISDAARLAAVAILVVMLVRWSNDTTGSEQPPGRRPAVAVIVDVSPSMETTVGDAGSSGSTRLDLVRRALRGPGREGVLARLDRGFDLRLFSAATRLDELAGGDPAARAAAIDRLACVPESPAASRIGDAVLDALDADPGGGPADAIVVFSDGVITAGAGWGRAATAAAARGVPLVTVPVVAAATGPEDPGRLPPGFRLTRILVPKLGRTDEPIEIAIEAESATFVPVTVRLRAGLEDEGPPLASAVLAAGDAAAPGRLTGTLVVPPRSFPGAGTRCLSPLIVAGEGRGEGRGAGEAAVAATLPLVVTDLPVDVLFVEEGPRFEWRFLERQLAADAAFAPRTVMLTATGAVAAAPGERSLPRSRSEWNDFDVAVVGDIPCDDAAAISESLAALGAASARDGIGIAWLPGRRWRESAGEGPDWLPARGAATRGPGDEEPLRLVPRAAGRDAAWLPWSGPGDAFAPEVFATAGPVLLGPSARVLAVAVPEGDPAGSSGRLPAIVIDRRGAGHVLAHLCETWRWRRTDPARYRGSWRHVLLRLAEPHVLARRCVATLTVDPPAPAAGEGVRITVAPTRSTADLTGWSLAVSPVGEPTATAAAETLHPLDRSPGTPGRPVTVALAGLAAGSHLLRMVPPGRAETDPTAGVPPPRHTLLVGPRRIERPGDRAATAAMEGATVAAGGTVVPNNRIDGLPEAIAGAIGRNSGGRATVDDAAPSGGSIRVGQPARSRPQGGRFASPVWDHWLMTGLLVALAAAWWPRPPHQSASEGTDASA